MNKYSLTEITEKLGINSEVIVKWVELKLVNPIEREKMYFDEEDLARIKLIHHFHEFQKIEHTSIEIILHLIDQIHYLQDELKKLKK